MLWPKSPKEKPCYTQPTVKKLLEQKRKRETSSVSPTCSLVPTSVASSAALSTLAPVDHSSAATGSSYSDMGAVGCDTWDPPIHPLSTPLQHVSPLSPMGMSYLSNLTACYSHGHSSHAAPSYAQQALQDCSSSLMTPQYPECQVTTMAPTSIAHSEPVSWMSSLRQQSAEPGPAPPPAPAPAPALAQAPSSVPGMDAWALEEARRFIQRMDYGTTTWQDDEGDTILHIYTAKGEREYAYAAAEKLKELGKLDSKEHKGKTALLVAVAANHPYIVHDLLTLGADVGVCDVKGQTALHLAAMYGYPNIMQVILSMGLQLDLEARNFEGLTPLHCAAISHSVTMKAMAAAYPTNHAVLMRECTLKFYCLEHLLNAGASLLSQEIKSNKTVLHLAVKEGNVHLVRSLLSIRRADMQAIINMKAHGHTALHMAAGLHGSPHQEELIRLLLELGADPSTRNLENDQPAHLLQSGDMGEKLKLILKKRGTSSRRRITSLQDQD